MNPVLRPDRADRSAAAPKTAGPPSPLTRRQAVATLAGGTGLLLAGGLGGGGGVTAAGQPSTPSAGVSSGRTPPPPRTTFVLVHGTFFDGSGWGQLGTLLETRGHIALAPDLPAHGADRTPIAAATLQTYVDRVLAIIGAPRTRVVLVGHSMGGIVTTEVAEQRPGKVDTLVYLAAYLPQGGQSLFDLAATDRDSQPGPKLVVDETTGVMTVPPAIFAETFLPDVAQAEAALATARLRPEPLAPLVAPVQTTEANFGRVRRVYVETLDDRVVSPTLQRRMYTTVPCETVRSLNTGHVPFLADPMALADLLLSV